MGQQVYYLLEFGYPSFDFDNLIPKLTNPLQLNSFDRRLLNQGWNKHVRST